MEDDEGDEVEVDACWTRDMISSVSSLKLREQEVEVAGTEANGRLKR